MFVKDSLNLPMFRSKLSTDVVLYRTVRQDSETPCHNDNYHYSFSGLHPVTTVVTRTRCR